MNNFPATIAEVSLSVKKDLTVTNQPSSTKDGYYLSIYKNYFFTIRNPNPDTYFNIANSDFTNSTNFIDADNMATGCFKTNSGTYAYFICSPLNLTITITPTESYSFTFSYPSGPTGPTPPDYEVIPYFSLSSSLTFNDPTYSQSFSGLYLPYIDISNEPKEKPTTTIINTKVFYLSDSNKISLSFYIVTAAVITDKDTQKISLSFTARQISGEEFVDGNKKDVFMLWQWASTINPYSQASGPDISGRWLLYSPDSLKNISINVLKTLSPDDLNKLSSDQLKDVSRLVVQSIINSSSSPKSNVIGLFYFSVLEKSLSQNININGAVIWNLETTPTSTTSAQKCGSLPNFQTCF